MRSVKVIFAFGILLINLVGFIQSEIINQKVEQLVDVASQLVKKQIKITAKDDAPFKEYNLHLPGFENDKLAFISAASTNDKEIVMKQDTQPGKYILQFPTSSLVQNFKLNVVLSKSLTPYPTEIKQSEKQLMQYDAFLNYYSEYKTLSQTSTIKLSSNNLLNYTQVKPVSVSSNKIKYGPYENIGPFNEQRVHVHYENQTPFLTVTQLHRDIEVSHWGNIAVKEHIYLYHSGAKLKGPFSRYDYQKDSRSGQSSVKYYKTFLPATATSVYYRDSNGNISTSNMKFHTDSVELELRPRFPLFGGWRTQYILGYNLPSFEYLYNRNDDYLLRMRLVDHIFDDMYIEKATVRIILPEGSSNLKLTTPYPVNRKANSLHFTYLDTTGRPVISFSKDNVVENHIADFEVTYNFSKTSLLQEPLLIIAFIFVVFTVTILFLRLDFSLNLTQHQHKE